jgi:hypothetical protein
MIAKEMNTPGIPKSTMAAKFSKNLFFFTWNLL